MHLVDLALVALQAPEADTTTDRLPALVVLAVIVAGVLVAYWRVVLRLVAVAALAIALVGLFAVLDAGGASDFLEQVENSVGPS